MLRRRFRGFVASWFRGFVASWLRGFVVSWFRGFVVHLQLHKHRHKQYFTDAEPIRILLRIKSCGTLS